MMERHLDRENKGLRRVLIAYDGSAASDFIFKDIRQAGLPKDVDALVLTVVEKQIVPEDVVGGPTHGGPIASPATASGVSKDAAMRLASLFPTWQIDAEAASGSPVRTILERAEKWNADLIIVGAVGHGALERLLIGSVSYKIANEAPCSVRIARGRSSYDQEIRIVLGYDDMPGSKLAVEAIAQRAWPKGTSVRLHTSVGHGDVPIAALVLPEDADLVRKQIAPAEETLRDAGLEVSVNIMEDDPKIGIVASAEAFRANCIFIGHNDHSLTSRLLLGTVASAVVPRATCSVEIVRPKIT